MQIAESPDRLLAHLAECGQTLDVLVLSTAAEVMAAFFDGDQAEGLASYGGEEDMLIAEWAPPFRAEGLEVILTRQWIAATGAIWQLQLRLHYPEVTLAPGSTDWQGTSAGFLTGLAGLIGELADRAPGSVGWVLDPA